MWPPSSTTPQAETLQPAPRRLRSKRWRELASSLAIVSALAEKCIQDSRRLNVMLGLPERPIAVETSSTSPGRPNNSYAPSSDTEATERLDESYP